MRILIIKPSSLGDVVHALPAVNLLRRRYPRAHISWLINDSFSSILRNCPVIDERIIFPRQKFGQVAELPSFFSFLRALRHRAFDLVIDLQGLFRSGVMTWATRARRRVGLSDSREGAGLSYTEVVSVAREHAVDRYLRVATYLGCDLSRIEFPIGSSAPDIAHVDQLVGNKRQLIAINPSARWKTKLWGDDKFSELVRQLPRERVVLTGSSADRSRIDALAPGCLNCAGRTDLSQLAELYRRCSVLITNDSGPLHVAAAVGTRVVAIFGPTDPVLTGPYGQQNAVLRADISCSPCMKASCFHSPQMECMNLITVNKVISAIGDLLL